MENFPNNQILDAMPAASREWLRTLEPVTLQSGAVLCEPDENIEHVYKELTQK